MENQHQFLSPLNVDQLGLPMGKIYSNKKYEEQQHQFAVSPPITPGESLFSPNEILSPEYHPTDFLSPPLTVHSGSPDIQDMHSAYDYTDPNPIYQFMGMDPQMIQNPYSYDYNELHSPPLQQAPYPTTMRVNQLKHAASDASLVSWSSNGSHPSFQQMQENWQAIQEPGFKCTFPGCQKVFSKQTNLKSHARIHHTERNYSCEECGASFRRSHDLKRHQRSLHSDVKPFGCSRCGKRFSRMVRNNFVFIL
jgi:uncharacterized Zn-finger protein